MFAHLALFVAFAASGNPQAGAPGDTSDVIVAGAVLDVALTAVHVWALQSETLVVLNHGGQVVQRLALPQPVVAPDARAQAAEQAARDKAMFNRFGMPESIRDTTQGEDWLDDNRSRADRAGAMPQIATSGTTTPSSSNWLMRASTDTVYLASSQGLWLVRDEDMTWRRVVSLPSAPLYLAANRAGTVAMTDALVMRVVHTNATSAVLQTCAVLSPTEWMAPLAAEQIGISCPGDGPLPALPPSPLPQSAPDLKVHSACNAAGRVFVNTNRGLFASEANAAAWRKVGGPAPFSQLRCNEAAPDVLLAFSPLGAGAALSANAGGNWQGLAGAEGQPAHAIAATESMAWMATSFGLLALPTTAAVPVEPIIPQRFLPPSPSRWRPLLPQVHVWAQWQKGARGDGQETTGAAAFLSAEFLLDGKDPTLRSASAPVFRGSQQALAHVQPPPCLARLRDSAAALALADPERMRAMASRAGNAGWLPELRFRAEKRWGRNQSLDLEDGSTFSPLGLDTVNDLRVEVRATWDLGRALYSPDELAVALGTLRVVDARQELMTLVNRLFFERRRLSAASEAARVEASTANPQATPAPTSNEPSSQDTEPLSARVSRLTADLDALTGGLGQSCW